MSATKVLISYPMSNTVRLKHPMVRRFAVEVEVTDEDSDEDIEVVECVRADTEKASPDGHKFGLHLKSGAEELTNYTVFVQTVGQTAKRYIDTNNGLVPISDSVTGLDQLIACQDLDQIEDVLHTNAAKSNGLSPKHKQKKQKKKKAVKVVTTETNNKTISVKGLRAEGIHPIGLNVFKCKVCEITVNGLTTAFNHSASDEHLKTKYGDDLKGLDAQFTIDSPKIGDAEVAIARRRELKKISLSDKQEYWSHGIRLKDGFGADAFICSACNLKFKSLKEVKKHVKSAEPIKEETPVVESASVQFVAKSVGSPPQLNKVDERLRNEGIKATETSAEFKFYCLFCNMYLDCKKVGVAHTNDPRHKKMKCGDNLNELDAKFTIKSDRINEFEVAFARRHYLRTISLDLKTCLTNAGIRLKDGTGSQAFYCVKCELSVDKYEELENHINSAFHSIDSLK
ncbi:unnamed protein product [Medioppia subpectinata]|uniref:C2H2-type domain-containing protein n=1 Tax=Medioppia subpectinata TaxID=1979941 RepID=A0A7R9KUN1_9ACAR|nr:unnamed protein product [Medioppia subpectinata]CAG2110198.1 unnamed protein product [Medioppia subpectinata]